MTMDAQSEAVEAVLDRYGLDESRRRRIRREAQHRLEGRATREVTRVLMSAALQGWRPPPSSSDVSELADDFALPIPQAVYQRVVRWARDAPGEFSVRDLQRASDWFDKAIDVRACLDGLVAQGEVEILPPELRWPGDRGRPPGTRYRAVRGRGAIVDPPGPEITRDTADADDLDWSFLFPPDHGIQKQ